jgi:hypothetical protein
MDNGSCTTGRSLSRASGRDGWGLLVTAFLAAGDILEHYAYFINFYLLCYLFAYIRLRQDAYIAAGRFLGIAIGVPMASVRNPSRDAIA